MFQVVAATTQLAAHSKRKEKARIAARARRSQEANIIMEMASELNIGQEKWRRIDKATIVKLAIDYIKAHDMLCNLEKCPNEKANDEYQAEDRKDGSEITSQRQLQQHQPSQQQQQQQQHQCQQQQQQQQNRQQPQQQQQQQPRPQAQPQRVAQPTPQPPLYSAPKLTTASIFAPKTQDNENSYFLMIEEKDNGKSSFVLKPDTEIQDEDDLTHLAPQAGDISISFETDPLDGIPLDDLLIP